MMTKVLERGNVIERAADGVAREIEAMRDELASAQAALIRLQGERRAALLTGTVERVAGFDHQFGLADARIDVAEARLKALEAEYTEIENKNQSEQAAANLARAEALATEAEKLIRGAYAVAAATIAKALTRLSEIRRETARLNGHLPAGVARIDVEEFRGFASSLGDAVKLPAVVASEDSDFWPVRSFR